MEELIKRLERVIQTGAPDKDGMHPISAETVLEVVKGNKVTIGDRIRRIRKKRRLTQAELAMMSGLSLSAIQGYEQGRYEPKRKSLESIAEVFKIPVDELYDMSTQLSTNLAEVGTDCISRQAAIDALTEYGNGRAVFISVGEAVIRIENLPPAEPKRGKWIRTGSGSLYDHYECSECGKAPKWECMGDNRWKIAFTDFCPNCGAKMEVTT